MRCKGKVRLDAGITLLKSRVELEWAAEGRGGVVSCFKCLSDISGE